MRRRKDDDSEQRVSHEADDDMDMIHLMLHLLNEDDEVELTDEEFSDNEDEIAEVFRIDTNIFDFETPIRMKNIRMIGSMNGTEMYHGLMRNHGLTLEFGLNPHQLRIINETHDERQELCETHELSGCNIRRFEMIKYSFGQDEDYVAVKEDEYDDLARTNDDACQAYQEIFRMMEER
ncbi:hypothetical protein Tco_1113693 [Tanacetum coccineum]|uniref:Uncharacterized protein n=1 Tax=Tanacetum coccineum TaxID=301880 RepID=A0ABQ5IUG9_9ASTR